MAAQIFFLPVLIFMANLRYFLILPNLICWRFSHSVFWEFWTCTGCKGQFSSFQGLWGLQKIHNGRKPAWNDLFRGISISKVLLFLLFLGMGIYNLIKKPFRQIFPTILNNEKTFEKTFKYFSSFCHENEWRNTIDRSFDITKHPTIYQHSQKAHWKKIIS